MSYCKKNTRLKCLSWKALKNFNLLEDGEGFPHGAGTAVAVDEILSSVTQHKQNIEHFFLRREEMEKKERRGRGGGQKTYFNFCFGIYTTS